MVIAIDFDGTCVEHCFPEIGRDVPGAEITLKRLINCGHQLILWTMRSDILNPISNDPNIIPFSGNYLTDAIQWFNDRNIELYGIQRNPTQDEWTSSPKAYAQLYIDDSALGCPLINPKGKIRPYVDWHEVEMFLMRKGILPWNSPNDLPEAFVHG